MSTEGSAAHILESRSWLTRYLLVITANIYRFIQEIHGMQEQNSDGAARGAGSVHFLIYPCCAVRAPNVRCAPSDISCTPAASIHRL